MSANAFMIFFFCKKHILVTLSSLILQISRAFVFNFNPSSYRVGWHTPNTPSKNRIKKSMWEYPNPLGWFKRLAIAFFYMFESFIAVLRVGMWVSMLP